MCKRVFVLSSVFVLSFVFSASAASKRSLKFGEPGINSAAKVHVYVDSREPAPRCRCVRFSVLVDDRLRNGIVGTTFINKVVVLAEGLDPEREEDASRVLTPWAVWRMPNSPGKTSQYILQLPSGSDGSDVHFRVLALKHKNLHPDYRDMVIDAQGEFTGADVSSLKASSVEEVLREKTSTRRSR